MLGSKSALTVASLATALLLGGGVYLYMNFGSLAKQLGEKIATQALGVPVTIGNVQVSIPDRTAGVTNIRIGNPDGFEKDTILTIGGIRITIDTIKTDLATFNAIQVVNSEINLEMGGKGSNLQALQRQIKDRAKANAAADKEKAAQQNADEAKATKGNPENIKVIIRDFTMQDTKINANISGLGEDVANVTMPDLVLKDIGVKQNGVLAREAIAQILDAVMRSAQNTAATEGLVGNISVDSIKEKGQEAIDKIKGLF